MAQITETQVLEALSEVMDPELNKSLVSLNMIRDVLIEESNVRFSLILTTSACPLKKQIEDSARVAVEAIAGVGTVIIDMGAEVPKAKGLPDKKAIPGIKNIIAVASGKGGVGKSTVAVNLALSLSKEGAAVGILDADVFGPSVPMMMGVHEQPQSTEDEKIIPIKSNGIEIMSVGFMLDEETPLIWRGPLVMQLVKQFLTGVVWGELDYLVIDLPPGTGDVQLTLVQTVPVTGVVIVTTPQDIALLDARRAIKMFGEVNVPIIGIAENMSYFVCPHCSEKTEIFSHGGGEKTSERYNVPLLGHIPLDPSIREGGDSGSPIVVAEPDSVQAKAIAEIAGRVAARISVLDLEESTEESAEGAEA
ncbi:MAG: iron-sulfur cluster carrier protein ApbC [Proteobacteria bacterium]|nr:iron-sulfur cluster carrier protein ApbC [Pseudomonadota bacterium]